MKALSIYLYRFFDPHTANSTEPTHLIVPIDKVTLVSTVGLYFDGMLARVEEYDMPIIEAMFKPNYGGPDIVTVDAYFMMKGFPIQ